MKTTININNLKGFVRFAENNYTSDSYGGRGYREGLRVALEYAQLESKTPEEKKADFEQAIKSIKYDMLDDSPQNLFSGSYRDAFKAAYELLFGEEL